METPREKRKEPRLISGMHVTVTLAGARDSLTLKGRVLDVSGSGMLLSLPSPLPCGSPVRVEGNDMLLLGEVCRCEGGPEQSRVALQIRHCLTSLSQLDALNRAILGGEARQRFVENSEPPVLKKE